MAQAQSLPVSAITLSSFRNGQSYEGNEGHEGHEGCSDEGNEEKERFEDRTGPSRKSLGVPRQQGKDRWRHEGLRPGQKQIRQGREQKAERQGQEEPMDC